MFRQIHQIAEFVLNKNDDNKTVAFAKNSVIIVYANIIFGQEEHNEKVF